jgi:hypothetical protein
MKGKLKIRRKILTSFERDVEFLLSHAIINSDSTEKRIEFVNNTLFQDSIKQVVIDKLKKSNV